MNTPSTPFPFLPRASLTARQCAGSILLGLGLTLPSLSFVGLILPAPSPAETHAHALRTAAFFLHPDALLLKAVLVYPFLEEVLFRGLLLPLCRRYLPTTIAVAIPSLLFALIHLRPDSTLATPLFALLTGALFGMLVVRTGSLLAPILCHASINFSLWFVINPILMTGVPKDFPAAVAHPVFIALLAGLAAVFVLGLAFLRTNTRQTAASPAS